MASEGEDAVVQVFFIRGGRLIGRDHFYLKIAENDTKSEILSSFIKQFYAGTPYIPAELMLPEEIEDQEIIEEWLTTRREHKVRLRIPKKGTKEKLVELAQKNAQMVLKNDKERLKREEGRTIGAVKELEKYWDLPELYVWRLMISLIQTDLIRLVLWSFMSMESQSVMIIANLR